MQVSLAMFTGLLSACGGNDDAEALIRDTFSVATAKAGQRYVTPAGLPRLLVKTSDGREAVVNPDTGRLLTHEDDGVFTSWARRIQDDGYTLAE